MHERSDEPPRSRPAEPASSTQVPTVEAAIRAKVAETLGGPRGAAESALPFVVFTVVYVVTDEVQPAVIAGVVAALVLFGVRSAQRSSTRFVANGLVAIVIAAVLATMTGRAETAFLPGIVQNAVYALVMGVSLAVRWPVMGVLIGAVTGDATGWRAEPAMVKLGNRLTIVFMIPFVLRLAIQYPLYLAGAVGWLGVARVVLGWPLLLAALVVAGALLARGHTPLAKPSTSGGSR